MGQKKSKVIYLESRKPSDTQKKKEVLDEAKQGLRINQAIEACNRSGHYSRVPNCLYEMGLSSQDQAIWLYFNRLRLWEHPLVDEIHKAVGIRKASALTGIQHLCDLNMLVVEGEGKYRRFHIPDPIYWKHEIPRSQYAIEADQETPIDITKGLFKGAVKKRSGRNVPGGTKKNVPGGTKKRSRRNEKDTKNVPGGTFSSLQTGSGSELEGFSNTSLEDLRRLNTNPTEENGQINLPGDGVKSMAITLAELEGSMLGLYERYTSPKVITALIKKMLREKPAEEILSLIDIERGKQNRLYEWNHTHTDIWLTKLGKKAAKGESDE